MKRQVRQFVHQSLKLSPQTLLIKKSIDRPNLFLKCQVIRGNTSKFEDLHFVVCDQRKGRKEHPRGLNEIDKTIIFIDNQVDGYSLTTILYQKTVRVI